MAGSLVQSVFVRLEHSIYLVQSARELLIQFPGRAWCVVSCFWPPRGQKQDCCSPTTFLSSRNDRSSDAGYRVSVAKPSWWLCIRGLRLGGFGRGWGERGDPMCL